MRSYVPLVPPFDDQVFPHQSYPPWQSLMRVVRLLALVLPESTDPAGLRVTESAPDRVAELSSARSTTLVSERG